MSEISSGRARPELGSWESSLGVAGWAGEAGF